MAPMAPMSEIDNKPKVRSDQIPMWKRKEKKRKSHANQLNYSKFKTRSYLKKKSDFFSRKKNQISYHYKFKRKKCNWIDSIV